MIRRRGGFCKFSMKIKKALLFNAFDRAFNRHHHRAGDVAHRRTEMQKGGKAVMLAHGGKILAAQITIHV